VNSTTNSNVEAPCCGEHFKFDIEDIHKISNLFFYYAGNNTILATYSKNEKMYLTISYDCGKTFEPPEEIMEINGTITNRQVLSKGHQFVIGVQIHDSRTNAEIKKAVSGWIHSKKITKYFNADEYIKSKNDKFAFKSCAVDKPENLINMSLAFVRMTPKGSENLKEKEHAMDFQNDEEENVHEASVDYVFIRRGDMISIGCTIHCGLFQ
jgi:hypothetical protein